MSEHIPHQEEHTDTRTNEELLHAALTEADEEVSGRAIMELHLRGGRDRRSGLVSGPDAATRGMGGRQGRLALQAVGRSD